MVSVPSENTTVLVSDDEGFSVDWAAVLGAVVIASASLSILTAFGAAIGFASVSPWKTNPSSTTLLVGAAAWFALTALYAGAVSGYIAGRLRKPDIDATLDQRNTRDGLHGLIAWGAGTLLSGILAAYVFTATLNKAADLTAQVAGPTLAEAVKGAGTSASDFLSYYVDRALRPANAPTANGTANSGADIRPEIARLLTRSLNGTMSDDDRAYVARTIAARTGVSEADAKTRVDQMVTDARAAYEKGVQQVKDAADKARKTAIETTTWFAIVALLSAIFSWFAAVVGGRHRDAANTL